MKYKKKKVKKYRGSKTHGGGAMKKRRGAGHRGGRGRAGSGKRGDAKKPSYWKEKTGRKGFASMSRKKIKALNLEEVHNKLNLWLKQGLVVKKPVGYEIELKKLGYNKLLGKGGVKEKLFIITDFASKKALEKVKKAGGEVKSLQVKKKKVKKAPVKKKVKEEEVQEGAEEVKAERAKDVKEEVKAESKKGEKK
ncbi:uL15 family ribosomal protein [Candidatus Woesearchaeota archaeon]|nr:uL15 family ribosomal protein [Candidatus Woesearchaeota archaeon]